MIKTSLKRAWKSSAVLFAGLVLLFSGYISIFYSPPALAANERYIFYYPDGEDQKLDIKSAYDKDGSDQVNDSAMEMTSILAYGGNLFGNTPQQLVYDPVVNKTLNVKGGHSDDKDQQFFTKWYYCTKDSGRVSFTVPEGNEKYYRITYAVALTIKNGDQVFNSDEYKDNYVGATKIVEVTPQTSGGSGQVGTEQKEKVLKDLKGNDGPEDLGNMDKVTNSACRPTPRGKNQIKVTNYYRAITTQADRDAVKELVTQANEKATSSGSVGGGDIGQLDCDIKFNNPLTYVVCPAVDLIAGAVSWLDSIITDQLTVKTNGIFCANGDTCNAFYSAWSSFRNIALGLLVLIALVILISQVLGFEFLDAYTIRKTLPRLLIAAILITLSWPLMKFAVEFTNDLGFAVRHLIYLPFAKLGTTLDLSFGGGIANVMFGTVATVGAVTAGVPAWIAVGGAGVMLSYAATAGLAVLIALLVLILRQIAIIMLIIFAPIAILTFVLPNTERWYKFWWDAFSKALLMFPLIIAFISIGRVFAAISISNAGAGSGPSAATYQMIAFVAYFAPYFLIPLTFRFAGGLLRQLGGFVNDRGRGAFDGLRNYRRGQSKERIKAARTGGLYRSDFGRFKVGKKEMSLGKMANTLGNALDADEMIPYGLGRAKVPGFKRTPEIVDDVLSSQAVEHSTNLAKKANMHYEGAWAILGKRDGLKWDDKTDEKLAAAGFYGAAARKNPGDAALRTRANWQAPQGDTDARKLADILQGDTSSETARRAGVSLASASSKLGTFRQDDDTRRADIETMAMITAGSQGRLEAEDYANTYNSMAGPKSVGQRLVQGAYYPGYEKRLAAKRMKAVMDMAQGQRAEQRDGKLINFDTHGRAYSVFQPKNRWKPNDEGIIAPDELALSNVRSMKGQALMAAKAETIETAGDTIAFLAGNGKGEDADLSPEEMSWRQQIGLGYANSYDDAGSRKAWYDVGIAAGMTPEQLERYTGMGAGIDPNLIGPKKEEGGDGGS